MKHALILAHWLTDFGGLHENVLDTAQGLVQAGWRVTVLAPSAAVAPRFAAAGARYLADPLEATEAAVGLALAQGPFDLVHAHPFAARRVGIRVAAALEVPLVVTLHGQYDDEFELYGSQVRRIICVSGAVADYVAARAPGLADRLCVIPNGVDFEVFAPASAPLVAAARTRIAIASRLDPDKGVLAQAVADLIEQAGTPALGRIELRIAGERLYGPSSNPFTAALDAAAASGGAVELMRCGWISDRLALRRFYGEADLVLAPGRAAMEAVACGVPTIAAASRGYIGLVTVDTLGLAQATNFGGVQLETTRYRPGAIVADIARAIEPRSDAMALRRELRKVHDLHTIQRAHVALYDALLNS